MENFKNKHLQEYIFQEKKFDVTLGLSKKACLHAIYQESVSDFPQAPASIQLTDQLAGRHQLHVRR